MGVPETRAYLHDDPDEHEREAFIACCTEPCQGDVALVSRAEVVAWLRAEADAMEHSPVCNNFGPMPMTCCGHCPVGIVRRLADALEAGDGGE